MPGPGTAGYGHAMDNPPQSAQSAKTPKAPKTARSSTPRPGAARTAWGGAGLYVLVLGLLIGGVPYAIGPLLGVVTLLAVTPLVPLLRHRPLAALALTLLGGTLVAGAAQNHSPGRFLVFLASDLVLGLVVATRPRRDAVMALVMVFVVELPAVALVASGPYDLMSTSLIAFLSLGAVYMTGLRFRERREHTAELRTKQVAEAVTAERLRIARELHDMVAHSIGVIAIQAGVGSRVIDTQPAEARAALQAIEATSRETLSGLRRTLVALRRAQPDGPREQAPLGPAPGSRTSTGWWPPPPTPECGSTYGGRGARSTASRGGPVGVPHRAGGADQRGPPRGHRTLPGHHRLRGTGADRGGRRRRARRARRHRKYGIRHHGHARAGQPAARPLQRRSPSRGGFRVEAALPLPLAAAALDGLR